MDKQLLSDFYGSLMAFLMMSKQQIVAIGAEHGLTAMQIFTIMHIDADDPRPMNTLCVALACDASNITGIIDGLEQKQLISRHASPTDRRVKTIQLEPKGVAVREQVIDELIAKNEKAFFSCLDDKEREQFAALMRKVTASCPRKIKV